jgi:hypothetical protein
LGNSVVTVDECRRLGFLKHRFRCRLLSRKVGADWQSERPQQECEEHTAVDNWVSIPLGTLECELPLLPFPRAEGVNHQLPPSLTEGTPVGIISQYFLFVRKVHSEQFQSDAY